VFVAVLTLALALSACGSATKKTVKQRAAVSSSHSPLLIGKSVSSYIPPGQAVRGDGDADNPADKDGNGDVDGTQDEDDDSSTKASYRFPDGDDAPALAYGRAATGAEKRAIASALRRYYAVASAGDGATACSLLTSDLARSVVEDYGRGSAGPSYLRSAGSCPAVLTLLFEHSHSQLAEAVTVLRVRVAGNNALAILSSRKMPASMVYLARQGGRWKIESLLGEALS
jgi:hypothetical protein